MSSQYFAVQPKLDCPHVGSVTNDPQEYLGVSLEEKCSTCSSSENWLCLSCQAVECSRYQNSHMLEHHTESLHSIVFSLVDSSFWCYLCDSYIQSESFNDLHHYFSMKKYNIDPQVENLKEFQAASNAYVVGGMYAVSPKYDCPHVNSDHLLDDFAELEQVSLGQQCPDCKNVGENWVCLKCKTVKCSRYINEHMLMHALETTHALCLSFSDLSFWCYHCESYIANPNLQRIYEIFSMKKFGTTRRSTAHISEEEKVEHFDSEEELDYKVSQLADWIRESHYFSVFTGAGISTSAGIPDYRSGYNTVLKTGPGAWERKAMNKPVEREVSNVPIEKALPTRTHMAFVKLVHEGLLKFVSSQNVDGLHRKSGIPIEMLAELHGNMNLEVCKTCKKEYMRDYCVRNNPHVHFHETFRNCDDPECRGKLLDTIINFGEDLNREIITKAFASSEKSDLCLAVGSSLRVTPAAHIPRDVAAHGKLVIVNLQKTPLDHLAHLKINAMCDIVMEKLMSKLGLEIPQFKLERLLKITAQNNSVAFQGIDTYGSPYSLFPKIEVKTPQDSVELTQEPMIYQTTQKQLTAVVHFEGHYREPPLEIQVNLSEGEKVYHLVFDFLSKTWEVI